MTLLERLREQVECKENPATNPAGSQSVSLATSEARALLAVVDSAVEARHLLQPYDGSYPSRQATMDALRALIAGLAPLTTDSTEGPNA